MIVKLPQHVQAWVESQVRAGRYPDVETVVSDSLEQFIRARQEHEWLESELQKGFDDVENGRVQSFDSIETLKEAITERIHARRG